MTHRKPKIEKSRLQIFHEAVERLAALLCDHPRFKRRVTAIRGRFSIPSDGIADMSDAMVWENEKGVRAALTKAVDDLVDEFNVPLELRSPIHFFVHDHILIGRSEAVQFIVWRTRILRPSGNADHDGRIANGSGVTAWIGIGGATTKQDVLDALKEVELRPTTTKKFGVPKWSDEDREAWLLAEKGASHKDIATRLNKKRDKKKIGYSDVSVKVSRYRKALGSLRPLK